MEKKQKIPTARLAVFFPTRWTGNNYSLKAGLTFKGYSKTTRTLKQLRIYTGLYQIGELIKMGCLLKINANIVKTF